MFPEMTKKRWVILSIFWGWMLWNNFGLIPFVIVTAFILTYMVENDTYENDD